MKKKSYRWKVFFWGILFALITIELSAGREVVWVDAEGVAPVTAGDLDKARDAAIAAAEQNAVAKVLAAGITMETFLVNLRFSGSILAAIPCGRIVDKQIVAQDLIKPSDGDADRDKRYRVKINAGVVEEPAGNNPSFKIDAKINKPVFSDGDELRIHIRSSKACCFALLNILEDNTIVPLLPNDRYKKNRLEQNENFTFPDSEDRKKGYSLRLHLPDGKTAVTEYIYILALLHPFVLEFNGAEKKSHAGVIDQKILIKELIRKVGQIPGDERAEALLQYEIRRTKVKDISLGLGTK